MERQDELQPDFPPPTNTHWVASQNQFSFQPALNIPQYVQYTQHSLQGSQPVQQHVQGFEQFSPALLPDHIQYRGSHINSDIISGSGSIEFERAQQLISHAIHPMRIQNGPSENMAHTSFRRSLHNHQRNEDVEGDTFPEACDLIYPQHISRMNNLGWGFGELQDLRLLQEQDIDGALSTGSNITTLHHPIDFNHNYRPLSGLQLSSPTLPNPHDDYDPAYDRLVTWIVEELPAELRLNIFSHKFGYGDFDITPVAVMTGERIEDMERKAEETVQQLIPFATSTGLRQEALEGFYTQRMVFDSTKVLKDFLCVLGPHRRYLTSVMLIGAYARTDAKQIFSLLAQCNRLLEICIGRFVLFNNPALKLTGERVDKWTQLLSMIAEDGLKLFTETRKANVLRVDESARAPHLNSKIKGKTFQDPGTPLDADKVNELIDSFGKRVVVLRKAPGQKKIRAPPEVLDQSQAAHPMMYPIEKWLKRLDGVEYVLPNCSIFNACYEGCMALLEDCAILPLAVQFLEWIRENGVPLNANGIYAMNDEQSLSLQHKLLQEFGKEEDVDMTADALINEDMVNVELTEAEKQAKRRKSVLSVLWNRGLLTAFIFFLYEVKVPGISKLPAESKLEFSRSTRCIWPSTYGTSIFIPDNEGEVEDPEWPFLQSTSGRLGHEHMTQINGLESVVTEMSSVIDTASLTGPSTSRLEAIAPQDTKLARANLQGLGYYGNGTRKRHNPFPAYFYFCWTKQPERYFDQGMKARHSFGPQGYRPTPVDEYTNTPVAESLEYRLEYGLPAEVKDSDENLH